MTDIAIYGVGGHARSVASNLMLCGFNILGYFHPDGSPQERLNDSISFLGATPSNEKIVLAIGSNSERRDLLNKFNVFEDLVAHPSSIINSSAKYDKANLVFANAYVGPMVTLGINCIINTGSIVEHDCIIGDHCHISIGAIIAGRARIGNNCFIGAGAVIRDGVRICDDVTIGAGSVVVKDIKIPGVYFGNPVKIAV